MNPCILWGGGGVFLRNTIITYPYHYTPINV